MRIGCLFGTFDPPHAAHVAVARHMRDHAALDQVWLVVTPENPFKSGMHRSPDDHRLAMVRLALMKEDNILASGIELDLPRPNYTVDTLSFMRLRFPDDRFSLIIGSDNLATFHTWKNAGEILQHHELLVYPRPGFEEHLRSADLAGHENVRIISNAPMMDTSSTAIREAIRNWRPVDHLVAPQVLSYVRQHKLYTAKGR